MSQKIQIFQKNERKKLQNALTSHYANGHGDPCDKLVKNHIDICTGHQVAFLKDLGFFHTCQHVCHDCHVVELDIKDQNHPLPFLAASLVDE